MRRNSSVLVSSTHPPCVGTRKIGRGTFHGCIYRSAWIGFGCARLHYLWTWQTDGFTTGTAGQESSRRETDPRQAMFFSLALTSVWKSSSVTTMGLRRSISPTSETTRATFIGRKSLGIRRRLPTMSAKPRRHYQRRLFVHTCRAYADMHVCSTGLAHKATEEDRGIGRASAF